MDRRKRTRRFQEAEPEESGFTLLEVMVALTILSLMLLLIFGAFRLGLSVWERGEVTKEEYQRLRIVSQMLSQQIKSMVPYKIKTQKAEADYIAFEGKANSLKFVSALPIKQKAPGGFVYAIYRFNEDGKEGGRLTLFEQRVLNKDFLEEDPKEELGISLLEGISSMTFEYYREEDSENNQDGGWFEEWSSKEEKELPRAVRITIKGNGKKGGASAPVTLLTSIPAYQLEEVRTMPTILRRMPIRQRIQTQGF